MALAHDPCLSPGYGPQGSHTWPICPRICHRNLGFVTETSLKPRKTLQNSPKYPIFALIWPKFSLFCLVLAKKCSILNKTVRKSKVHSKKRSKMVENHSKMVLSMLQFAHATLLSLIFAHATVVWFKKCACYSGFVHATLH